MSSSNQTLRSALNDINSPSDDLPQKEYGSSYESVQQQIENTQDGINTFDNLEDFNEHINKMTAIVEEEYKQKKRFRLFATIIALFLVVYSIVFITLLFGYLVVCRGYIPESSVLIAISVTFIANIIGLATIVFKYVFSSTKETTDYISHIK